MNQMNIRKLEQRLINNSQTNNSSRQKPQVEFSDVLNNIKDEREIKFSKHARERLYSRQINLSKTDINKLEDAFEKAESKGVRDALIILDDQAFIASIDNKTVVTAVGKENLEDNIFTNIDGAVII